MRPGADVAADRRFRDALGHFERGEYFEAHEVWEDQWRGLRGEPRLFVQALIQSAVALHHFRRGNAAGARALRDAVFSKLSLLPPDYGGLDLEGFSADFAAALTPLDRPDAPAGAAPRLRNLGG